MAALRRLLRTISGTSNAFRHSAFKDIGGAERISRGFRSNRNAHFVVFSAAGFGVLYLAKSLIKGNQNLLSFSFPKQVVAAAKNEGQDTHSPHNRREARFQQFASLQYEGNVFMTPQDFLESVTDQTPRPRIGRTRLTRPDLDGVLKQTPAINKGSDKLFRKLHDKGVISYTEYLFLLCVLTMSSQSGGMTKGKKKGTNEPHSGFRIAFNMFDTDGNQKVDKKEFLVLESFFALPANERKFVPRDAEQLQKLFDLEKVFSSNKSAAAASPSQPDAGKPSEEDNSQSLKQEIIDTTLLVHFFGKKGNEVLNYKDFHRFMENLQNEIIELEFMEFSKGLNTISEVEFANILLRYTNLDSGEIETCINRIREKFTNEKGIRLEEFSQFFHFLNNLDDFSIAMKMYTFSNKSISQEEFQRAVKICTGYTLGSHIVDTVFQLFDADGDGHLSHKEFISIMKDRLHRGAKSHLMENHTSWNAFKACIKDKMRSL